MQHILRSLQEGIISRATLQFAVATYSQLMLHSRERSLCVGVAIHIIGCYSDHGIVCQNAIKVYLDPTLR